MVGGTPPTAPLAAGDGTAGKRLTRQRLHIELQQLRQRLEWERERARAAEERAREEMDRERERARAAEERAREEMDRERETAQSEIDRLHSEAASLKILLEARVRGANIQ